MDCMVHGVAKSRTQLSDFYPLCFQRSFIIQSFRVISEVIYCLVIQPAFKPHFQAPTVCYLQGHRVELDHYPLALETLLTHSFSNAHGALLCTLAGIWGWVLGRKRAWLVGAGVNQPHRSCLCVREEQEAREDAVGAVDAHQGVLVGGLQKDGLFLLQLEHDAACGDLEGVLDVVAEGDHLLGRFPAPHDVHAQLPSGAGVVGEEVEPGHLARELAGPSLVVFIGIGDNMVEADGLA